jgi:hypothetical protein
MLLVVLWIGRVDAVTLRTRHMEDSLGGLASDALLVQSQLSRAHAILGQAATDGVTSTSDVEAHDSIDDSIEQVMRSHALVTDVGSAISDATEAVNSAGSSEGEAVSGTASESKDKLTAYEGDMEEALTAAKDAALTRLKITEDRAEEWEGAVSGRIQDQQEKAQAALKEAQEASLKRIEEVAQQLEERFKAAELRASVEREELDRAADTRLQAQLDLATAEKLTLESFVRRADARVQLAEQKGQTQVNGEVGVTANELKRFDMDDNRAQQLGSELETEHNKLVHDAIIQTAQMQAQSQKQLETLRQEKAEKLAEAQAASAADQAAVTTAEAKMAYAPLMQNVQMAANLNTQTVLAGSPARRPAFV